MSMLAEDILHYLLTVQKWSYRDLSCWTVGNLEGKSERQVSNRDFHPVVVFLMATVFFPWVPSF